MGKIYKGWELMKAIEEGKIKNGSRFNVYRTYSAIAVLEDRILHIEDGNKRILTTNDLLIYTFELIEDEPIDIDKIEELLKIEEYEVDKTDTIINRNKINELVQAVKQLNKEIKSIKEK